MNTNSLIYKICKLEKELRDMKEEIDAIVEDIGDNSEKSEKIEKNIEDDKELLKNRINELNMKADNHQSLHNFMNNRLITFEIKVDNLTDEFVKIVNVVNIIIDKVNYLLDRDSVESSSESSDDSSEDFSSGAEYVETEKDTILREIREGKRNENGWLIFDADVKILRARKRERTYPPKSIEEYKGQHKGQYIKCMNELNMYFKAKNGLLDEKDYADHKNLYKKCDYLIKSEFIKSEGGSRYEGCYDCPCGFNFCKYHINDLKKRVDLEFIKQLKIYEKKGIKDEDIDIYRGKHPFD